VADGADLIVDDVEVVDQPLGRRADGGAHAHVFAKGLVRLLDTRLVVIEARAQGIAPPRTHDGITLAHSDGLGVLLQLGETQELAT
jgi:hypothetical protein